MNQEKRLFFQGLKLQIGVVDLVPYFCSLIPQNEFIYSIRYSNSARNAFVEDITLSPPLLPSELIKKPRSHIRDAYLVDISDDTIKIYTKSVKKTDKGIRAVENTYTFTILDLIDP